MIPDDSELPLLSPPNTGRDVRDPQTASTTSLSPGQMLLDRYELLEELSGHGLLRRYRAMDRVRRQEVLVTLAPTSAFATSRQRQQLVERIENLCQLESPLTSRVLAVHETESWVLWCEESPGVGRSLRQEMDSRRRSGARFRAEEVQRLGIAFAGAILSTRQHGQIATIPAVDAWWLLDAHQVRLSGLADQVALNAWQPSGEQQSTTSEAAAVRKLAEVCYELLLETPPATEPTAPHLLRSSIPTKFSLAILAGLKGGERGGYGTLAGFRRALERSLIKQGESWWQQLVPTLLVGLIVAVAIGLWAYRQYTSEAHLKPKYAEAQGRVTSLKEQAKGLDKAIVDVAKKTQKDCEDLERDLAGAQDANKPTQATLLSRQLDELRLRRDREVLVSDLWQRHSQKQTWLATGNGELQRAETLAKDENYVAAIEAIDRAAASLESLVQWQNVAHQVLEQSERAKASIAAAQQTLRDLPAEVFSWPLETVRSATRRLGESSGVEVLAALKRIEPFLKQLYELADARRNWQTTLQTLTLPKAPEDYHLRLSRNEQAAREVDKAIQAGDCDKALETYRTLVEQAQAIPREFVQAQLEIARAAVRAEESRGLKQMLTETLTMEKLPDALRPDLIEVRLLLAQLSLKQLDLPLSIEQASLVLERAPQHTQAAATRAQAHALQWQIARALTDVGVVLRVEPQNVMMLALKAQLELEQESPEDAVKTLEQLTRVDPLHATVGISQQRVLLQRHENAMLLNLTTRSPGGSLEPRLQAAHLSMHAEALLRAGQPRQASETAIRALELDNQFTEAYDVLLRCYRQLSETSALRAFTEQALQTLPTSSPTALLTRSLLRQSQGNATQARQEIEAAVAMAPEWHRGYIRRAELEMATGELPAALADCQKALELCATSRTARSLRGQVHLAQKEYALAAEDWNAVLKLAPYDLDTLQQRAWLLACCPDDTIRQGVQAFADATRCYEQHPTHSPELLATLAAAYAENGDFAAAIEWQNKTIAAQRDLLARREAQYVLRLYTQGKPRRLP